MIRSRRTVACFVARPNGFQTRRIDAGTHASPPDCWGTSSIDPHHHRSRSEWKQCKRWNGVQKAMPWYADAMQWCPEAIGSDPIPSACSLQAIGSHEIGNARVRAKKAWAEKYDHDPASEATSILHTTPLRFARVLALIVELHVFPRRSCV